MISWLKDDIPIEFDERIQQIEHLDGVCELIINKPTVKDSGNFTCSATNSIGTGKVSHQVEFQPPASYPGSRRESGLSTVGGAASGAESDTDSKADPKEGSQKGRAPRTKLPPSEKKMEETSSRSRPAPPTMEEISKAK